MEVRKTSVVMSGALIREILGDAVKADMTVTFIGRKLGQIIKEGPQTCGEIVFDDLEVPGEIFKLVTPVTRR